jgi:hypothetical protein
VERATAVIDANGNVTVNWPAGAFSRPARCDGQHAGDCRLPVAHDHLELGHGDDDQRAVRARVSLLGIQLLAASIPAAGVTSPRARHRCVKLRGRELDH